MTGPIFSCTHLADTDIPFELNPEKNQWHLFGRSFRKLALHGVWHLISLKSHAHDNYMHALDTSAHKSHSKHKTIVVRENLCSKSAQTLTDKYPAREHLCCMSMACDEQHVPSGCTGYMPTVKFTFKTLEVGIM